MWDLLVGYAGIVWFRPAGGSDLEPAPWLPGAVQALSPDGMLVMVNSVPTLTLIDLQTRTRTELPRGGWSAMQCAFSPASDEVAVLWVNGDEAVVTVGPATGDTRREIWRAEGGCNQESAVAWSPTGAQIAVTWQVYDEDEDADFHRTAVIDLNGNELARRENARMFPANPAAWTADGSLHLVDQEIDISAFTQVHLWGPVAPPESPLWNPPGSRTATGERIVATAPQQLPAELVILRPDGAVDRSITALPVLSDPSRPAAVSRVLTVPSFIG